MLFKFYHHILIYNLLLCYFIQPCIGGCQASITSFPWKLFPITRRIFQPHEGPTQSHACMLRPIPHQSQISGYNSTQDDQDDFQEIRREYGLLA